ncbi:MAG: nucleotidyltransferase domain-containing protein [Candidatus Woesearchaeota archaeon]
MVIKVNDMDLKVLSLFTKGYDKEYYIREAEKLLHVSSRTALVTLAKLEKQGILESRIRGKIKFYKIKKSSISKEFFILAEQYKKIQFLENNHLIKEILEKADQYIQGMAIIFGSYAKSTKKDDSDLDLFLAGRHDKDKIKEIGKKYGISISIKSYPLKIFEKEINTDILLKEVAENHILIKDAEEFVGRIAEWTK